MVLSWLLRQQNFPVQWSWIYKQSHISANLVVVHKTLTKTLRRVSRGASACREWGLLNMHQLMGQGVNLLKDLSDCRQNYKAGRKFNSFI